MNRERGLTLISVLLISFLLSALGLLLAVQLLDEWEMTEDLDAQLQSFVLAENGIEYAKAVLPALEINALLRGLDGISQSPGPPEWRNPAPLDYGRRVPPEDWILEVDDGLPFHEGKLLFPTGYASPTGGHFFIRFSNNPEEAADEDADCIVIIRSMGVVRPAFRSLWIPHLRNAVTLLEATLRQERTFDLPSPLTLLGDEGDFQWEGAAFQISAQGASAVSVISLSRPGLKERLEDSLQDEQKLCLKGDGPPPSVQDHTSAWQSHPSHRRALAPLFWDHFLGRLPVFSRTHDEIVFLPDGGIFDDHFKGILVASGDLTLRGQARIEGLLLHLGGGRLVLEGEAQVRGALWLSHLETEGGQLLGRPLLLAVRQHALVVYDRDHIQRALARLPPTVLGWRILTPEMIL